MASKKILIIFAALGLMKCSNQPSHEDSHHIVRENIHTPTKDNKVQQKDNQYWEKDPNCTEWNQRKCVKCSLSSYFEDGRCVQSNPNCKTFHEQSCTSCYQGYDLRSGKCVVDNDDVIDPLCHQFKEGICVQCSSRAYFGHKHKCVSVNPLCKTFDRRDGGCQSCYDGYELRNDNCVVDKDWNKKHGDDKKEQRKEDSVEHPKSDKSKIKKHHGRWQHRGY